MLIVLNTETQSKDIVRMLNKVINVQVCDATGDEEVTAVEIIKTMEVLIRPHFLKNIFHHFLYKQQILLYRM